jgi:hypothetical protein
MRSAEPCVFFVEQQKTAAESAGREQAGQARIVAATIS